jgi:uncharacterized protein YbjT (DUF2867 family)
MSYKAIIIGASGLIGSELVKLVTKNDHFSELVLISRRPLVNSNNKVRQLVIHFDQLRDISSEISGEVIFSCLGTNKGKTPDSADYRKIEHDYTLNIANIGLSNNVRQYHFVSSLGADPTSSSSYLKLKGEVEDDLKKLTFNSLHLYQPSYLTGDRVEKRLDDKLMRPLMSVLDKFLIGSLGKYKSISAEVVARAMVHQCLENKKGVFTYPSNIIKQLA